MDRNHLIGDKNRLPWHLPADFAHFKAVTMGKPILMGRKTYESIGKPLPGRHNIVLTRSPGLVIEGVTVVNSLDAAIAATELEEEIMVIGGSTIYEMLLPRADRMYLTHVEAEFKGDAWFPKFDESDWKVTDSELCQSDEKNSYACRFVTYEKK